MTAMKTVKNLWIRDHSITKTFKTLTLRTVLELKSETNSRSASWPERIRVSTDVLRDVSHILVNDLNCSVARFYWMPYIFDVLFVLKQRRQLPCPFPFIVFHLSSLAVCFRVARWGEMSSSGSFRRGLFEASFRRTPSLLIKSISWRIVRLSMPSSSPIQQKTQFLDP